MKKENGNVIVKQDCHSRVFLSGIFRVFSRYAHKGNTLFINNSYIEDPRLQISGMTALYNNGFTLIELLVVVLIIGILAAVAVPQYRKAVYKSRAVEAVTLIKALVDAQEIYYLANGEYTDDISKLDVNIPAELIKSSWAADPLFEDKYSYTCARKTECAASSKNNNLPDFQFNFRTGRTDANAGKFYCNLGSGDSKTDMAKAICQSMGRLDESRTQSWEIGKYFIIN